MTEHCFFCGVEFTRTPQHANQKFCSPNCRYKTWRREHVEEARAAGRAHNNKWRTDNPGGSKKAEWKNKGIVDLDNALDLWNGDHVCAICGKTEGRFCIDHDHMTGKTRGLLCDDCNIALGRFYDSPNILEKAIAYLEKGS